MPDKGSYPNSNSNANSVHQDYNTSAPVITPGTGNSVNSEPKSLIDAISQIQQFYAFENMGQEIPREFFTLNGICNYFKVGASSGFSEGMFVFLLFPIFHFYLTPFVLKTDSLMLKGIVLSIPFMSIIMNGFICMYVSRYYIGSLTRQAINSLFSGRLIVLMMKSLVIYIVYTFVTQLSKPNYVWAIVKHFGKNSESIYTHYMQILPHMMPMATKCSICMFLAAIIPYGSVFLYDVFRTSNAKRNRMRIMGK